MQITVSTTLAVVAAVLMAVSSAERHVLFGTFTEGAVYDQLSVWLNAVAGAPPQSVRMRNIGWAAANAQADVASLTSAWQETGSVPVLTWMPYAYANWSSPTPNADITNGAYDEYLDDFLTELATSFIHGQVPPRRVYIRFAPSPNGNWFPWSPYCPACSSNGQAISQSAQSYIDMWRYVYKFAQRPKYGLGSKDTVQWVYDVATYDASGAPSTFYPGDDVVDWLSVTGNNYGSTLPGNNWVTATELYQATILALTQINSSKPIALSCAGTVSQPLGVTAKAAWLTDLLTAYIPSTPNIRMLVMQNQDNGDSDLAIFGGSAGSALWTSPMPMSGAYWSYSAFAAGVATAKSKGSAFIGFNQTNPRLIDDRDFAGN
jgi:mannan endo-1,4-beta-mannosidase